MHQLRQENYSTTCNTIIATGDIPEHFKVDLWPEPNREDNVFGSKAVEEPPFMLAISVYEALKAAVAAGRGDEEIVKLTAPATAENILASLTFKKHTPA